MRACVEGGISAVRVLEQEASKPEFDINRTYPDAERTLLHMASENCHSEVVAWLIDRRADLDATDQVSLCCRHTAWFFSRYYQWCSQHCQRWLN